MKKFWKKVFILSLLLGCLNSTNNLWACTKSSYSDRYETWLECDEYKLTGTCPSRNSDDEDDDGPSEEEILAAAAEITKEEAEAAVEAAKAKEEALREQLENLGEDNPEREKLLAELEEAQNQAEFAEAVLNAKTLGDPVLLTSGQFLFSETDISIKSRINEVSITRKNYGNSNNNSNPHFGPGWNSNLDTRIIRCKTLTSETLLSYYESKQSYWSNYVSELEKLKTDFTYSETGYSSVDEIYEEAKDCYEKIESMYNNAKLELETVTNLYNIEKDKKEKSNKIDSLNKYVSYGDAENYTASGIDYIVFYTEEATPILCKSTEKGIWIPESLNYSSKIKIYSANGEDSLESNGFIVDFGNGNKSYYNEYGILEKKIDRAGNQTIYESSKGLIVKITTNEGKTINIERDSNGKILKIAANEDEVITYSYFNNKLDSVTDSDGDKVKYEYTNGKLTKIIKPDLSFVYISYSTVNGEQVVTSTTDENGHTEYFRYKPNYSATKGLTEHINYDGTTSLHYYDKVSHNTTEEHYADGTVRYYEYDAAENLISETYRNDKTTYSYDERGNKTAIKYSDGSTELFTYNSFDQITYYKDRDGVDVFYVYDEIGNILSIRKGGSYIFQGQYNKDLLVKSTDGLNVVTEYEYDKYGNVTSIKTGDSIEKYTYDSRNRVVSYVDGEGNTTTYTYTQKTTTEKSSNGLERIYYYNNRKDLVKIEEKDTITKENRITNLLYDKTHNLLEVTNPSTIDENGKPIPLEKYTYTENNEVKTATYNDGKDFWQTTYIYDNAGRVSSTITTKNGSGSFYQEDYTYSSATDRELWRMVTTGENRGTVYKYDKWERVTSVTNALGETSERVLSKAGRTLKENSSHGGAYTYTYANGNLIALGEENKTQVKTEYYDDGSVKSTTDRLGNKTEYFYNTKGELEKTISSENATWYTYDKAGRITGQYITEPNAQSYQTNQDSYITYSYKNNGRTVVSNYGGLYSQTIKLNAFGEVLEVIDGENNTIKYEYDSLGRQIAVYDGYSKPTKYEYNALGLVSKVTYRDETIESYEYDNLGNVTKITDVEGIKAEYTYDTVGRLLSAKERGNPLTEYRYDELDRVTEVKLAGEVVERYEYTSRGRKTTVIDGNENKYQYNYDEFGRLVNETNRLEDSQSYFYDDEGNLETKKDFANKTTTYEYDAKTRTKTTYFSDGTQTVYEYSPSGNLLHVTGETGTISYSYNKAGLLVSQVDHGAGETTYYSYNKAGQKTKVESDSRTLVYSYGKNAEVIKVEDYTTKMSVSLSYDVMGRETKRQYKNGVSENTVYDKLGRVILKSETNLYGKVYFAESYVYKDGKRALTVTDKGEVTLYKYNQRGEIESVYYPYSESLEVMAKKEALEAGLYPNFAEFEWYNYSNEEQEQIKEALGRIYKNIPVKIQNGQRVWSEHYTYDNNSNRLTKTTKYGTINYTYDDENRLRYSGKENLVNLEAEIGGRITFAEDGEIYYAATSDSVAYNATSLKGTRYTYDANGNMLSSESLYSVKFFDYNENNRMKLSTVTDLIEHSYTATTYAYDGFGRRTLSQTQGETATRTLYDGTSFEILRQGTADSNGSFVNVAEAENRYSPYQTRGFGNHYNKHGFDDYFYYLFFGGIWGFGNGGHGSNNGKEEAPEYLSIENMYPIYANGSVSGTYTENLVYSPHQDYWNKWENFWGNDASKYDDYATYKETLYFGTDILGSVRSTTNVTGSYLGSVNYEIFGKPYERSGSFVTDSSLDFGYLGKPYNADTELYDYGFRDYSPEIARFTSVDPIRDGRNWYSYVMNDPVNYVDLWGLCGSDRENKADFGDILKAFGEGLVDGVVSDITGLWNIITHPVQSFNEAKNTITSEFNALFSNPFVYVSEKIDNTKQTFEDFWNSSLEEKAYLAGVATEKIAVAVASATATATAKVSSSTKPSTATKVGTCFIGGTLVSTENGFVPIESINIGDKVYSYNEDLNTVELNKVTNTFVHLETELIILKSNETEITTTKTHPFWTKEKGWIFADELEVGDTFLSKTGEYHTLNSIYRETLAEPIFVYNIEVENAHTYFVSDSEILVHNKSEKMLHLGKYSVSNTEFHGPGGIKENILKKAGKYNKRVGNNPDIKVLADGSITLQGTGPFKGKSMKTDLKIETFFEDD